MTVPIFRSLIAAIAMIPGLASAMDNPVHLTVIDGWQQIDGTRLAGVRLDLDDGWKTYWRAPGEAGIPPFFDFTSSQNLGAFEVEWPAPVVFDQGGMKTVGYKGFVIFPLVLTPIDGTRPIDLRGSIDLGVCKDVCLPVSLDVDVHIDGAKTERTPALVAARASQPFSSTEAGVRKVSCSLAPTSDGLTLSTRITMPSAGHPEITVVESPDPDHWLTETTNTRDGDTLISTSTLSSMSGQSLAVNRSQLRITILGSDYAVDIQGCSAG